MTDPDLGGMDLTVVAVADSEPYVRLSAAMFDALPGRGHTVGLAVVRSPLTPAPARLRRAVAGTGLADRRVPVLTLPELRRLVRRRVPDAVMLNCTARVADALADILPTGRRRPVVVSALAGPALPAGEHEWLHRARADLLVLHSLREVAAFSELGEKVGAGSAVALAGLPLPAARERRGGRPHRVVFAAQDGVPGTARMRERVLEALAGLAESRPDLEVVVCPGERRSPAPGGDYAELWRGLVGAGRVHDHTVLFRPGPVADQLDRARGLVTVGSPAALEAIALDVPVIVLGDVGEDPGATVFEDGGIFGTLDDLRALRFRAPTPEWARENHFHPPELEDWTRRLAALVRRARRGDLPARPALLDAGAHRRARRRVLADLGGAPSLLRQGPRVSWPEP
ncbi:DUF6716 putative glycosyltransferase [Nocardiopsis flavescens]|uniref:Uncharacterized protein n=1 Tax=Nocardiopsis flavescens TaxID=758803 RepID=A0A1M6SMF4_9ACTN|nr:DUF6716 putative glycosyltransferase [Nocardiopsis flavescens]SHK45893.1 hypothetical protein SAMN05421803_12086 [Nocardiopsis flavescens]